LNQLCKELLTFESKWEVWQVIAAGRCMDVVHFNRFQRWGVTFLLLWLLQTPGNEDLSGI